MDRGSRDHIIGSSREGDKITALDSGADDYVPNFRIGGASARMRVALRNPFSLSPPEAPVYK